MSTLIIGAGQAGLSCAAELKKRQPEAKVTLIGDETSPPYQRPPLSKAYLAGDLTQDRLWLKPEAWYEKAGVDLVTGSRVKAIDRSDQTVILGSGERHAYETLVLATGGRARRLDIPGADLPGVHYLRSLEETEALSDAMIGAKRLAIIGAGYIGLEVAASARKKGLDVVVVEAAERPMARTASSLLGGWFGALHRGYGVDLRIMTPVEGIAGTDRAEGVTLKGGEVVDADLVLIAAGLVTETGLAEAAGLTVDNGIHVDERARSDDPSIYAIGDVSSFPSRRYGRRLRLESVQNAIEQGKAAAQAIAGMDVSYDPVPWFWSDQYDIKLQITGLIEGADHHVRRGDPEEGRFAIFHYAGDTFVACEAVDCPAEYMAAQRMLLQGISPDPDRLRNLDVAMKDFLS